MYTIQLKINEKVYEKFLWLLSKFTKEEIEIISDDQEFVSVQKYLQEELDEIKSGKATFYSQNELENRLDQVIEKHEGRL